MRDLQITGGRKRRTGFDHSRSAEYDRSLHDHSQQLRNTHGHPQTTAFGCSGSITTTVPAGHDPATDNLSAVFNAQYTDDPGDDLPSLSGSDQVRLTPGTAP